jgi:hypothetical protein
MENDNCERQWIPIVPGRPKRLSIEHRSSLSPIAELLIDWRVYEDSQSPPEFQVSNTPAAGSRRPSNVEGAQENAVATKTLLPPLINHIQDFQPPPPPPQQQPNRSPQSLLGRLRNRIDGHTNMSIMKRHDSAASLQSNISATSTNNKDSNNTGSRPQINSTRPIFVSPLEECSLTIFGRQLGYSRDEIIKVSVFGQDLTDNLQFHHSGQLSVTVPPMPALLSWMHNCGAATSDEDLMFSKCRWEGEIVVQTISGGASAPFTLSCYYELPNNGVDSQSSLDTRRRFRRPPVKQHRQTASDGEILAAAVCNIKVDAGETISDGRLRSSKSSLELGFDGNGNSNGGGKDEVERQIIPASPPLAVMPVCSQEDGQSSELENVKAYLSKVLSVVVDRYPALLEEISRK